MNSISEKSPKAFSDLTRDRRSLISGIENSAFSVPRPLRALTDVDQPILVAVDERPQQHAADDAEDRGVGADAKGERDDDGDGESLDPGQRAQRDSGNR